MTAPADPELMRRALRLAEHGWGRVHPNPLVGAIVVAADGRVIAEAWHQEFGGAHAEAAALAVAGPEARGATLYVTLEPCAHHGQTPPCTDAILAAGIRRVCFAAHDPNPKARGGADILRAAGVQVEGGVLEDDARRQNAAFCFWHERQQPYVALKLALSIDGAIGLPDQPRVLVTGSAARREANRLRAGYDAVLVGIGTVLADDPGLTVRDHPVRVPPRRVILDSDARLPHDRRLLNDGAAPVIVCCAPDADTGRVAALRARGVTVHAVPRAARGLSVAAVLENLRAHGVRSVFCEGGAGVARALLEADRVERQYLFMAARRLGPGGLRPLAELPETAPGAWRVAGAGTWDEDALLELERVRSEHVHGDR